MLKRILAVIAATLLGLAGAAGPAQGATLLPAAPASQVAMDPTCPVTEICLHTGVFWDGVTFDADPWGLPANTCFNFNSYWNDNVNSFWWNEDDPFWYGAYAEIYEGPNCTIRALARVLPGGTPFEQMRSCNEGFYWTGPCGPPNNVAQRASSWAFTMG